MRTSKRQKIADLEATLSSANDRVAESNQVIWKLRHENKYLSQEARWRAQDAHQATKDRQEAQKELDQARDRIAELEASDAAWRSTFGSKVEVYLATGRKLALDGEAVIVPEPGWHGIAAGDLVVRSGDLITLHVPACEHRGWRRLAAAEEAQ